MTVALFEGQRQEMIAAIRVIAPHLAEETGKTALDDRVLVAMAKVPRHEFVPIEIQPYAYLNRPLPIGFDKTVSQPLMVAVMTDQLSSRLTTWSWRLAQGWAINPRCSPSWRPRRELARTRAVRQGDRYGSA
jgi:Protein-L-isoaspartate(D-aspartate) O-methyltransferase (PCMT)